MPSVLLISDLLRFNLKLFHIIRVIYILNKRTQAKNAEFLLHFAFKVSQLQLRDLGVRRQISCFGMETDISIVLA